MYFSAATFREAEKILLSRFFQLRGGTPNSEKKTIILVLFEPFYGKMFQRFSAKGGIPTISTNLFFWQTLLAFGGGGALN